MNSEHGGQDETREKFVRRLISEAFDASIEKILAIDEVRNPVVAAKFEKEVRDNSGQYPRDVVVAKAAVTSFLHILFDMLDNREDVSIVLRMENEQFFINEGIEGELAGYLFDASDEDLGWLTRYSKYF